MLTAQTYWYDPIYQGTLLFARFDDPVNFGTRSVMRRNLDRVFWVLNPGKAHPDRLGPWIVEGDQWERFSLYRQVSSHLACGIISDELTSVHAPLSEDVFKLVLPSCSCV